MKISNLSKTTKIDVEAIRRVLDEAMRKFSEGPHDLLPPGLEKKFCKKTTLHTHKVIELEPS